MDILTIIVGGLAALLFLKWLVKFSIKLVIGLAIAAIILVPTLMGHLF